MEFQDVVRRRRMVRAFTDEPVSDESVRRIMRNALRGPSAGFSQGQAFLVLRGEEKARFHDLVRPWTVRSVRTAPVLVVPFAVKDAYLDRYAQPDKGWTDRGEDHWPVPFWYVDTGMAVLLILQTAVDEGLGAVYFGIGAEDVDAVREAFGVPADHEPIGAVAIGHGAEAGVSPGASPNTRGRRPFDEAVHFGRW
ncbi:nitroreductase family protein [Saccharothrix longispora]|uniref:nitroreductase family protein n=1 Tax=Saccharothrix longispora TaxID=33920 RepID=UPI0028FD8155|nr:nitroreductase family protein [Saccharothrix longispora]MDU0292122.1 nitroreductase family protein [Saccharothrix longispora]